MGCRDEAGVEHQVEPRHGEEYPAQEEGGIHDVGQHHHTQGANHNRGGQYPENDQLGDFSKGGH